MLNSFSMMLLFPKKSKFSKSFSGKKVTAKNSSGEVNNKYANVCLVAQESGKITNFQLESLRRFLRRFLKKKAQLFFRLFPNVPVTKKPNDVRLGRGKGNLKY
jgi:large subunit ribosomal protein L16